MAAGEARPARATATTNSSPGRRCRVRAPAFSGAHLARSRSQPLEPPEALPVRHGRAERCELDVGGVEVMRDDLLAERLPRDLAACEQLTRVRERGGHPRAILVGVGVALQR